MTKRFAASGLMTDIDTDFRDGVTEVQVAPDREKAAGSGVSVQDIADTINTAIGGVRQGYFTNGIRRYDVRIRSCRSNGAPPPTSTSSSSAPATVS